MEFNKLISSRYSVRSFSNQKVEHSTILEILEAARLAPSAVNYQPYCFIVINNPKDLAEFQEVYPRNWFKEASVCIVVCSNHDLSWKRKLDGKDFADVDVAIVTDHLVLKATEIGLGTCWVCNFNATLASKLLNLPNHIEPLVIVPIGYTNSIAPEKKRKPISELVHWGKFTNL